MIIDGMTSNTTVTNVIIGRLGVSRGFPCRLVYFLSKLDNFAVRMPFYGM